MNALSTIEKEVVNNITKVRNASVKLGDILQLIISSIGQEGTPVNAAEATATLTFSGVVIHGEYIEINNPLDAGADKYEFLADAAQTKSNPSNIAVNITSYAAKAVCTLTLAVQPTSGDKMVIGARAYTFVPIGTDTANNEISVGDSLAAAKANLISALKGEDGHNLVNTDVTVGDFVGDNLTLTAIKGGVAGNSIVTTETFTAGSNVFSSATLVNGTDCTAANAATALAAAITASDTQHVGGVKSGSTVVLTADVAGAAGNNISLGKSLTNGGFGAGVSALSGGIDGTVGEAGKILVDSSYLYIAIAKNTVSGKNWRRISVGNAF